MVVLVWQLTNLVEMHTQAAHELLDRVEVETINMPAPSAYDSKDEEIAHLRKKIAKTESELNESLADAEARRLREKELKNQVVCACFAGTRLNHPPDIIPVMTQYCLHKTLSGYTCVSRYLQIMTSSTGFVRS